MKGKVKDLDVYLEHISFRKYSDLVAKMENYSNLSALEMFEKGIQAGPFTPMHHGLWMFLRTFLLEFGFLHGFDGFMISVMNAGGSFMKYAKLREMRVFKNNTSYPL